MALREQTGDRLRRIEKLARDGDTIDPADILWMASVVRESDSIISWETTCAMCAKLLDDNYAQYEELTRLKQKYSLLPTEHQL